MLSWLPILLSLLLTLAAGNPMIWMTSLISVEEEKPNTIAPSGKSVTEFGSSVTTGLLVSTGWMVVSFTSDSVATIGAVEVVVGAAVVVVSIVVVLTGVVVVEVDEPAGRGLALRPLFRILSPICWARREGAVSSGRLTNGVTAGFLTPGLSLNLIDLVIHYYLLSILGSYLNRRVVRADKMLTGDPVLLTPSVGFGGAVVVVVVGLNLLGEARFGTILIVSIGASLVSTGLAVVVVVGLAGRRASNPAKPLVDPTVASVETAGCWLGSLSETSEDSLIVVAVVVVRPAPGRRPANGLTIPLVEVEIVASVGISV